MTLLIALNLLLTLCYFVFKVRHDLHMFQQNSYRPERYLKWMQQTAQPVIKKSDIMFAIGSGIAVLPLLTLNDYIGLLGFIVGLPFMALSVLMFHVKTTYQPAKKKLVWTKRVRRLLITAFIWLNLLFAFAFVSHGVWFIWLSMLFTVIYSWGIMLLANLTNTPIESGINAYYYNDAKKRLQANPNLIIIGITGSYGKTSVKNVLYQLLSQKYNVLMTPESYNTLMGVIRTVREKLNPTHEVFIVEMGAKQTGDIAEICKLVNPHIGIITSIGPQHLDTFKTLENVISTKGELFGGVQSGGRIFVNLADDNIKKLTLRQDLTAFTFGREPHKKLDYAITQEQLTEDGTAFTVSIKKGKERRAVQLKTRLLGAHNVDNLLGSIAIGLELGLTEAQINRALFDMHPVKHRLSVSRSPLGYTILDDAFNSNPVGSKNALTALKQMKGNRKIIMTPGMIELGDQQEALNEAFGEYIAAVCDYVVLVGKRQTEPIQKGLEKKKYPKDKLFIAKNLNEAFGAVNQYAKAGDVLLIENDLPDAFNE